MSLQIHDIYCYAPLSDKSKIRILTLYPGRHRDRLAGELSVVDIDQAGDYEALSYVWGYPVRCSEFICSNKIIWLTSSLSGALRRVRRHDRPRRIWVDQLSINQDDTDERSKQVQFMNTIFKNATHVLVWLGEDSNVEAQNAFQLIHRLDQTFKNEDRKEEFRLMYTEHLHDQSAEVWTPLKSLTANPWFTRGWIIQEIGTRALATLYWGDSECDWAIVYRAAKGLAVFHHMRYHFDLKTSEIKYIFQRFIEPEKSSRHANRFSLVYELQRARHCKLTDPRDRVFAFLGHYSVHMGNTLLAEMQADYTRTIKEVYADVARRSLLGDPEQSLITLAAVQHTRLPSRLDTIDAGEANFGVALPSWVPDWRIFESHMMSEPVSPHCAHGTRKSQLTVDGDVLLVRGIRVDALEACSGPLRHKEFHHDPTRKALAVEFLWKGICGKTRFDLEDLYLNDPNNAPAVLAYLQTLSIGGIATALRDGRTYRDISQEEWLAQGAAYLKKALGDSNLVSAELQQKAANGDYYNWTRDANGAASNRAFGRTVKGRYLLGPKVMEPGDIVCVLFGGKMPFVLRPWTDDMFLLVGECYVHGLMNGEAIKMVECGDFGECVDETFHIC